MGIGYLGNDHTMWILLHMRFAWLGYCEMDINFINKQEGKTIVEVMKDLKKAKDDLQNS